MEVVALILSPIIMLMRLVLDGLYGVLGSYGLAIILLSVIVRVVMIPIVRMASNADDRHEAVMAAMGPELASIRQSYRGRDRFEKIDELYTRNGYHPIHAMASILPLLLQLPFLLSALFLLSNHEPLNGVPFLFLRDLSQPDHLLPVSSTLSVNLLPLILTGVAMVEAWIKPSSGSSGKFKFAILAVVIAALIYPLASALCLYWLTSNLWSFAAALIRRFRTS